MGRAAGLFWAERDANDLNAAAYDLASQQGMELKLRQCRAASKSEVRCIVCQRRPSFEHLSHTSERQPPHVLGRGFSRCASSQRALGRKAKICVKQRCKRRPLRRRAALSPGVSNQVMQVRRVGLRNQAYVSKI